VGTRQSRTRERYQLLYLKVFNDMARDMSPGLALGAEFAMRLAAVRSCAASLPGPDQIRALETAALAKSRETMTRPRSAPWPRRR